jgi:hypothetical protein
MTRLDAIRMTLAAALLLLAAGEAFIRYDRWKET